MPSTACLNGHCSYCNGCDHDCHHPDQASLFDPPASVYNQTGSPTGRITSDAPDTSRSAARRSGAASLREQVHTLLAANGRLSSIEVAAAIPQIVVSNRANSRLGELWEEGRAAVVRERGVCVLGVCHPHTKPHVIHRPQAGCSVHGKPITRDGAALWTAL